MSKALKCNRCENFFDPVDVKGEFCHFENPAIRTSENYILGTNGRFLLEKRTADDMIVSEKIVDLCPNCTKEFISFMNLGRRSTI